jgi:hypothetical protein
MSKSRQVLKFDLSTDGPLTTIPIEDERFYEFIEAGSSSTDAGWTEKPSVWVVDRTRKEYDADVSELVVLSIPADFEVSGTYAEKIDPDNYLGTIANSDKSYVRHVFDVTPQPTTTEPWPRLRRNSASTFSGSTATKADYSPVASPRT